MEEKRCCMCCGREFREGEVSHEFTDSRGERGLVCVRCLRKILLISAAVCAGVALCFAALLLMMT